MKRIKLTSSIVLKVFASIGVPGVVFISIAIMGVVAILISNNL